VSRGPGLQAVSGPGVKRVRVDRNGDSEGDPFGSDEEEFMEAARAARTSTGWERGVEAENYPSGLSAEDCGRILDRIRALEEKARDIVGEISALKTYFLHWGEDYIYAVRKAFGIHWKVFQIYSMYMTLMMNFRVNITFT
jgi:hypothetical protein